MTNQVDAELTERSKELVAALAADAAWIKKRAAELKEQRKKRRKNGKTS